MKRFLLFQYDCYYPLGGWSDFKGSFDDLAGAKNALISLPSHDHWQIVDSQTQNVVEDNVGGSYYHS